LIVFLYVSCECGESHAHIADRKLSKLIAQPAGRAATIGHRDDLSDLMCVCMCTQSVQHVVRTRPAADHDNVVVNWNSNSVDMDENGSIDWSFDLLKHKIEYCHITDIGVYQYPWQDLFDKLEGIGYDGYSMAEIQPNDQPERFMKYYRTLFDLYTGKYTWPRS